jgi:AcrR family transcriptional regulator
VSPRTAALYAGGVDAPAGRGGSRDAIWAAATELFTARGYAATSVRRIAAMAGVDAALVLRYFGSKESLFLDTMQLRLPQPLFSGDLDTLGERFVRTVLTSDDQVKGVFLALLRASGAAAVRTRLRELHEQEFVAPLLRRLTGPDAEVRARLAAGLVGGLLYALWAVGDDRLAAADPELVVSEYGALLQALITPGT